MRIPRPLRAIAGGLRRALDLFPLTALGLFVGAAAGLALWQLAYQQLDLVVLVVGYGAVGLVGLALLTVVPTALGLGLRLRRRRGSLGSGEQPVVMETGIAHATGFTLPALRWMPLVQLRWTWERPAGARVETVARKSGRRWGRRLAEEVTLEERGEIREVRRRVVVQDAFGLARVAFALRDDARLRVLPRAGGLRRMPLLASLAGGDDQPHPMGLDEGDRVELRRYAPGDPARFIHWKVFGRTRKLMVRVPERALSRARRVVAYQAAGASDDASAGAARVAVESGALGAEWTFSADGGGGVGVSRVDEALDLVVGSVQAREPGTPSKQGAEALEAFVQRAEREGGPATVVVFAPPRPGPWLARVVALARVRRGRMRVVVAVDGIEQPAERPWWKRALTRAEPPGGGVPHSELDEVLRTLGGARCDVVVLDRVTGKRVGDAHRAAMRQARRRRDGDRQTPAPEIAA